MKLKHCKTVGKFGQIEATVVGEYVSFCVGAVKVVTSATLMANRELPFINGRGVMFWLRDNTGDCPYANTTADVSHATSAGPFVSDLRRHARTHLLSLDLAIVNELDPWAIMAELVGV